MADINNYVELLPNEFIHQGEKLSLRIKKKKGKWVIRYLRPFDPKKDLELTMLKMKPLYVKRLEVFGSSLNETAKETIETLIKIHRNQASLIYESPIKEEKDFKKFYKNYEKL